MPWMISKPSSFFLLGDECSISRSVWALGPFNLSGILCPAFGVLVSTCLVQESANTKGDHTHFWTFFLYNHLFLRALPHNSHSLSLSDPSYLLPYSLSWFYLIPPPPHHCVHGMEIASNREQSTGSFVSFFLKDSSQCLKPVVSCFVQVSSCLLQDVRYSPCYFFIARLSFWFFIVMIIFI